MKYKAIAEQIITDIQSQKLTLGQRLPSLRKLTKQLDVSMTTALNSYRSLEQMGWVVTHPKSGFFVSTPLSQGNVPDLPQFRSSSRRISTKFKSGDYSRNYENGEFISGPFGVSQLCPSNIPLRSLKQSIKRTTQSGDQFLHTYADPQGIHELRRAIAEHFSGNGFPLTADDLFISGGCMDAVRTALLVTTKPGDAVAISSPCFNGLLTLLSSMSRRVVEIPCNSDGIDLQQLEQKLKNKEIKAALFSSSFMNPHGISLSITQKRKLAALANKYRVPIIEDDIYSELGYDNIFPLPIKYWDTKGYVLWCSSVSKSLASGLRIGWCSAGRYLQACVDVCRTERLGQNSLMQASLADFINSGQYRKHLQSIRKIMLTNVCAYRHLLLQNLPEGSAISAPNGGLVLWVQIPGLDEIKLRTVTDAVQVDISFGAQFTTRKLYGDCFRLNIGWGLSEMHDPERTIEQALLQFTAGICHVLGEKLVNQERQLKRADSIVTKNSPPPS
ncbi:MAG: PLP-dependent aminotransferase family protein [Arenicella sp.]|nr:PLP-dependent aminotransferase family protein [Arenicella sp.]